MPDRVSASVCTMSYQSGTGVTSARWLKFSSVMRYTEFGKSSSHTAVATSR